MSVHITFRLFTLINMIIVTSISHAITAEWTQIKESDTCVITSTLPYPINPEITGLFGSDKGLFFYSHSLNGPFWHQYIGLPQGNNTIIRTVSSKLILVVINTTLTMGKLYCGIDVDTITQWTFGITDTIQNTDVYTSQEIESDSFTSKFTLFFASGDSISKTEYYYDFMVSPVPKKTGSPQSVFTPLNSFGTNSPFCADLHVFSADSALYAGGYDRDTNSGVTGSLLALQNDSMVVIKKLNVSCLAEGRFDADSLKLFIGTQDSGIYLYDPGSSLERWSVIPSPNDGPVIDIITINNRLIVAVASGVYIRNGNEWKELGDIPVQPLCLGSYIHKLYAGTVRGVYIYQDTISSPVLHMVKRKNIKNFRILCKKDKIFFSHDIPGRPMQLSVFTASGRLILRKEILENRTVLCHNFSSGVYYIRLTHGRRSITEKAVLAN